MFVVPTTHDCPAESVVFEPLFSLASDHQPPAICPSMPYWLSLFLVAVRHGAEKTLVQSRMVC